MDIVATTRKAINNNLSSTVKNESRTDTGVSRLKLGA